MEGKSLGKLSQPPPVGTRKVTEWIEIKEKAKK